MYMDGRENEKIRYLETKYDTDVRHGLLTTEVGSRAGRERFYNFTDRITKDKRRIWLQCMKLEMINPLFFFLLYIGAVMALLQKSTAWFFLGGIALVFLIKIKRVKRHEKNIMKFKERESPQAKVLRDGLFKKIPVRNLVPGDVLRLRRGEAVPAAVISLNPPFRSYLKNMVFTENAGKAIVTEVSAGLERRQGINIGKSSENLMLQEIFAARGIFLAPSFFLKNGEEALPDMEVVAFDSGFFPGRTQCAEFRFFMERLHFLGISCFFFTDCGKEEAVKRGLLAEILTSEREVVDSGQLALLKGNHLRKQAEGIRVYCGLSDREKERVKAAWQELGKKLFFLTLPEEKRNSEAVFMQRTTSFSGMAFEKVCLAAPDSENLKLADCCFDGYWKTDILKYLEGQRLALRFFEGMRLLENRLLPLLSVFVFCLIFVAIIFGKRSDMSLVLRTSAGACAGYVIFKEIMTELFRAYLLKRLSEDGGKKDFISVKESKARALSREAASEMAVTREEDDSNIF